MIFLWKLKFVIVNFLIYSIFFLELIFEVPPQLLAVLSVLYGSISLLAVIGNLLVMWIVKTTRQMHTVTNFFIGKWLKENSVEKRFKEDLIYEKY